MDFIESDDDISGEEFETENDSQVVTEVDATLKNAPQYETKNSEEIVKQNEEIHRDAETYNIRSLSRDAPTYELEKFEKRFLLIFNQVNVTGRKPRVGTKQDVRALKKTFGNLGFTVKENTDLTCAEIKSELEKLGEIDFTDHGCVVVAVLTHGGAQGRLWAKDASYNEDDIMAYIKPDKNPTLLTKPRILIVQACRGRDSLAGMTVGESSTVYKDDDETTEPYTLPVEADILVIHSSFVGKASHRTIYGSWFIQTLCRKIDEFAPTLHIEDILLKVKQDVATNYEYKELNEDKNTIEWNKQIPVSTSMLMRKLYLRKYQA